MKDKNILPHGLNPPRDINYAEGFTGVNRKTLRRWWEQNKFPAPVLVQGKLYWLDSVLTNWKIETFGEIK